MLLKINLLTFSFKENENCYCFVKHTKFLKIKFNNIKSLHSTSTDFVILKIIRSQPQFIGFSRFAETFFSFTFKIVSFHNFFLYFQFILRKNLILQEKKRMRWNKSIFWKAFYCFLSHKTGFSSSSIKSKSSEKNNIFLWIMFSCFHNIWCEFSIYVQFNPNIPLWFSRWHVTGFNYLSLSLTESTKWTFLFLQHANLHDFQILTATFGKNFINIKLVGTFLLLESLQNFNFPHTQQSY